MAFRIAQLHPESATWSAHLHSRPLMSSPFGVGDIKEQPLNLLQDLTINPAGGREWCKSVEERYCAE